MATMTETFGTIFLEDLDRIDVSIFDPSRGVVGESWHVDLHVSGPLDDNGFVQDFSPLKAEVKQAIKGSIDHALIVPAGSPAVQTEDLGGEIHLRLTDHSGEKPFDWEYSAPREAVLHVGGETVSTEAVEAAIATRLAETAAAHLTNIRVKLRAESAHPTEAFFSYTHGITGHRGLCQRLLHGHRSRLKVEIDGERRPDLEHRLVTDVLGPSVHIGARWQIKSGPVEPYMRTSARDRKPVRLAYKGTLGSYYAVVPSDRFLLIDGETSIENLTLFLAKYLQRDYHDSKIAVSCYEGIGKGALVEL